MWRAPWNRARRLAPGLLLCAVVALSATFVAEHYGGPQLLYALLIGLAFHFLSRDPKIRPGIDFCGRTLLRAGVALLGLRITFTQISALGWGTGALTALGVASTIALGLLLAHLLRRPVAEGLVSGCAVGICGASAALAVSSVLPQTRENERFTLLAVVGVTLLSTLAMVLYPLASSLMGLTPAQAGVFFGATIHDVAQVVAAGMMLSNAGDTAAADSATVIKVFRVMLLMPVVLLVAMAMRPPASVAGAVDKASEDLSVPLVPGFLLAFIVCMLLATSGLVPAAVSSTASQASRWLLVVAIAAAGVKTSFEDLFRLGWMPVAMLVTETLWIALFAGSGLLLMARLG
ncbi:hypothetical protein FQZ97_672330 [compost metagenome]|jgi:uncharacterized integral membrane protein (TIGR00698 family)